MYVLFSVDNSKSDSVNLSLFYASFVFYHYSHYCHCLDWGKTLGYSAKAQQNCCFILAALSLSLSLSIRAHLFALSLGAAINIFILFLSYTVCYTCPHESMTLDMRVVIGSDGTNPPGFIPLWLTLIKVAMLQRGKMTNIYV